MARRDKPEATGSFLRKVIPGRKKDELQASLGPIEKRIRKRGGLSAAPIDDLCEGIRTCLDHGDAVSAYRRLREAWQERKDVGDRTSLLEQAMPALEGNVGPDAILFLWRAWASIHRPDSCYEVSRSFSSVPHEELDEFLQKAEQRAEEEEKDPRRNLAIVHVRFRAQAYKLCLPALRILAAAHERYSVHAVEMIDRIHERLPDVPLEFRWASLEIHLDAKQRGAALEILRNLASEAPSESVEWMRGATKRGALTPEEVERETLCALERSPTSGPLLEFLYRKRMEENDDERSLMALMTLVRAAATPEDTAGYVSWLEPLLERNPPALEFRAARAEVLSRAGLAEELEASLVDILEESPERVLEVLGHWPDGAAGLPPALEVIRGRALDRLSRWDEAAEAMTRVLASGYEPEKIVGPLRRLASVTPRHGPYRLLLFRCLHKLDRQEEALEAIEPLLESPPIELQRVIELVNDATFSREALPRSISLLVRASLDLGWREQALEHLGRLAREDRELFRAALAYSLRWRSDWIQSTKLTRGLASLLFEGDLIAEAIDLLDASSTEQPGEAEQRAGELVAVFAADAVASRREPEVLQCRYRLLRQAGKQFDAFRTAVALSEAGEREEAHGDFLDLLEHPDVKGSVLPHLLTSSIRLDRPEEELLRHARAIRELDDPVLVERCHEELKRRDAAAPLGLDGLDFLGWSAVDLSRYEDAVAYFTRVLEEEDPRGDAGLVRVIEDRPELVKVRVRLADSRRQRGLPDEALAVLLEAPKRTGEIREAHRRLVEHPPSHLPTWYSFASALEKEKDWGRLVQHLGLLHHLADVEHEFIGQSLERLRAAAQPSRDALWLAVMTDRKLGDDEKVIATLSELLRLQEDAPETVLAVIDELRQDRQDDFALLLADLRLSAEAGEVDRVVAAGREALRSHTEKTPREQALEAMLEVGSRPEFDRSRAFQQELLDLGASTHREDVARKAYDRLREHDRADPARRLESAYKFADEFGDDLTRLVHKVEALLDQDKAADTVFAIQKIASWKPAPGKKSNLAQARELADRAAGMAEADITVRQLASALAAQNGDVDEAHRHALGAIGERTRVRVYEQLCEHSARFTEDPRFEMSSALEVCEPGGALEKAADHLGVALDRDPELADPVYEAAVRLSEANPDSTIIQSVRARSAVLLSSASVKAARAAVTDIERLATLARGRSEEALTRLDAVLEHRPELLVGRFLRQKLLRTLGRPEEAVEELSEQILVRAKADEEEALARYQLADALEAVDRYDDALEEWRRLERREGADEEQRHEILVRVRRNFARRAAWEMRKAAADGVLRRACVALKAGHPEDALAAVPPAAEGDEEIEIPLLAVRGAALRALGRHDQVIEELRPHLTRIPESPPLSPFEREFLFALGKSLLVVDEPSWAFRCLELLARDAPEYRGVRRILDHAYHLQAACARRPVEVSRTLEELGHAP